MNRMKILITLICLCVSSICWANQAVQTTAYTLKWTTWKNSHVPMIVVVLDDGKQHKFIIDSGAPNSVIDTAVAKKMKLPLQVQKFDGGISVNYINTHANFGPDVFSLPQLPLVLSDLGAFQQADPTISGILGVNLLNNFALDLNFTRQELTLIPGGKIAGTAYEPKTAHCLKLLSADNHWWVDGMLDGSKVRFNVDTGADNIALEDKSLVDTLMPTKSINGPQVGVVAELSSKSQWVETRLMRLHKLTVGDISLDQPVVQYIPVKRETAYNSLGVDFLQRFHVILDLPAQQIYFTPDPAYHDDPQAYVGTGAEFARDSDKIVVSRVISPSPAQQAGLRNGDEIVVWGRLQAKDISDLVLQILTQAKVGTEQTFTLRRSGEKTLRMITLKVEKLL